MAGLPLTLFVLLGLVLKFMLGHYAPVPLLILMAAFVAFSVCCAAYRPSCVVGSFDANPIGPWPWLQHYLPFCCGPCPE